MEPATYYQKDQYMHYRNTRKKREDGAERIFEETITENFSSLMQDINLHIQDVQQTPRRINLHIETYYNQTIKR